MNQGSIISIKFLRHNFISSDDESLALNATFVLRDESDAFFTMV